MTERELRLVCMYMEQRRFASGLLLKEARAKGEELVSARLEAEMNAWRSATMLLVTLFDLSETTFEVTT